MKKILILILSLLLAVSACAFVGCGEKPFTVTFDGNGGTLIAGESKQTVLSADEISEPTYTREGYIFDGWDTDISKITEDATVKAKWTEKENPPETVYTVNFELPEGIIKNASDYKTVTVKRGETLGDSLPDPVFNETATVHYDITSAVNDGWYYKIGEEKFFIDANTVFNEKNIKARTITLCLKYSTWAGPF